MGYPHLAPMPRGLVFQLTAKLAHTDIGNRARQVVILHHPFDVQVFNSDHVGAPDECGGGFVQEVRTTGGDAGMNPGYFAPLPVAAITPFLHPRQSPLLAFEVSHSALQVAPKWLIQNNKD